MKKGCMEILDAGCKVNLGLRITGVRPDGYHELDSLFWPLPHPHDRLKIRPLHSGGLKLCCAQPGFPADNTLTRAYALFTRAAGHAPSLELTLHKGIPQGAGLGGGSSDAAALLIWLNARAERPLTGQDLSAIAARVGADTPFFLQSSPCRVRGIGEILEPVGRTLNGWHLVLVCPMIHVSTPWAFEAYDAARAGQNSLTIAGGGANGIFLSGGHPLPDMHNDLEAVVLACHPQLAVIKTDLLRFGAEAAGMSGSGSSMVGLFAAENAAQDAARHLRRENWRVFTHVL